MISGYNLKISNLAVNDSHLIMYLVLEYMRTFKLFCRQISNDGIKFL